MRVFSSLMVSMFIAALMAAPASAQTAAEAAYPSRVIRIVNGFTAGGPTDVVSRVVADNLSKRWHQPVLVEYKLGAGGDIAMEFTASSPADGYTLVTAPTGSLVINQYISKVRYDSFKDFVPISLLVSIDNVLIAPPGLPARNLKEFIEYAKANRGKLNYGSPGIGTQPHLAGEMFKVATGTEMLHVPYKGTPPAITATMAGEITATFAQLSAAAPFVESGKVRGIGIAGKKRSPLLPNVPTLDEQGLTGFESASIYALMAPRGTPAPIVDKLAAEIGRILREPAAQKTLSSLGMDVIGSTPDQLAALMRAEAARYEKIIKDARIKAD